MSFRKNTSLCTGLLCCLSKQITPVSPTLHLHGPFSICFPVCPKLSLPIYNVELSSSPKPPTHGASGNHLTFSKHPFLPGSMRPVLVIVRRNEAMHGEGHQLSRMCPWSSLFIPARGWGGRPVMNSDKNDFFPI